MKIVACGSRNWRDEELIYNALLTHFDLGQHVLIHGGAIGADRLSGKAAERINMDPDLGRSIQIEVVLPDWDRYGKSAGFRRNQQMIDMKPNLVLAFWDGASRGTAHSIEITRKAGIPIEVFIDKNPYSGHRLVGPTLPSSFGGL